MTHPPLLVMLPVRLSPAHRRQNFDVDPMCARGATVTPDEIFEAFQEDFQQRQYVGGLLPALIDFVLALELPSSEVDSLDDLFEQFPQQHRTRQDLQANTLIVEQSDGSHLSIRPFYNDVETYFRADEHRHDFPSCAPHATQAWDQYTDWIDSLCGMSEAELRDLRQRVVDHVLDVLPDRSFDPDSVIVEPPAFRLLLEEFDFGAPNGEPTGAAFQGAVFGFIRADNPHLQVQIDSVRTGSSRRQRVGDIDAWDGERLAITAEVKAYVFPSSDVDDLSNFVNEVNRRGAIGLVVAFDLEEEAREELAQAGTIPLTVQDLIDIVELWDPAKQRTAVKSFVYYAEHVEQNSTLADRLNGFLDSLEEREVGGGTPADESDTTEAATEDRPAAEVTEETAAGRSAAESDQS